MCKRKVPNSITEETFSAFWKAQGDLNKQEPIARTLLKHVEKDRIKNAARWNIFLDKHFDDLWAKESK